MSVRRGHAGKVDQSQPPIIAALRKAGMTAVSIAQVGGGVPDVLAGWRGITALLECKTGNEPLNAAEREFHATWAGHIAVVRTPEEAVIAVLKHYEAVMGERAA